MLQEVDGNGKGSLLTFLHGAGLIGAENPAVALIGANLRGTDLREAYLHGANLQGAHLLRADLQEAYLQGTSGLTEEQIEWTIGSNKTRLEEDLNRPEQWSKSFLEQLTIVEGLIDADNIDEG